MPDQCLKENRLFQKTYHRTNPLRPRSNRAEVAVRSVGFTLVELMVVLGIVSILLIAGMVGFNHYKEQYAFSAAVRELTNAVTIARVRAIQSQSNSRLVFRPIVRDAVTGTPLPLAPWQGPTLKHPTQPGHQYNIGDIVQHDPWTYRCIFAHLSTANDEPSFGPGWKTDWEIIFDYQYNNLLLDVQHCAGSDPTVCAWDTPGLNANPYNALAPVSIRFNWFGVPVDYVDHNIRAQGAHDLALGRTPTVGDVTLTVTALGRIKHLSGPTFQGENE